MDKEAICFMSACDMLDAIKRQEITSQEITETIIERIKKINPILNAFCTELSNLLRKGYEDIIKDANIKALVQSAGTSGTVHFSGAEKIENWRDFVNTIDIARWFLYTVIMMNRGIMPSAFGPDEQWTISVQHTKEGIEKHLEVFKEIAEHVKKIDLDMPMVEAI